MITAHCPRCSETFRLPAADLPHDAMAECPWCGETYSVAEIVGQLPPLVQLRSADGAPLYLDHGTALPFASDMAETDMASQVSEQQQLDETRIEKTWSAESDRTVDDVSSLVAEPSESIDFESEPTIGEAAMEEPVLEEEPYDDWGDLQVADSPMVNSESGSEMGGAVSPMRVNARPRQKTKSSPIKGILGTIAGLLLAIPLAGGILLAIGKAPDLGFWPFLASDANSQRAAALVNSSSSNGSNKWSRPNPSSDGLESDLQDLNDKLAAEVANSDTVPSSNDEPMAKPSDYLAGVPAGTDAGADPGQVSYPQEAQDVASDKILPGKGSDSSADLGSTIDGMPLPENYDENFNPDNVALLLESFAGSSGKSDPTSTEPKLADQSDEPALEKTIEPSSEEPSSEEPSSEEPSTEEMPTQELSMPGGAVLPETPVDGTELNSADAANVDTETTVVDERTVPTTDAAVEAAVTNANKYLARLMRYDGEESAKRNLFALAYEAVAKVAAEPGAGANSSVDRLLTNLVRSPLVDDLGNAANIWLDYPKRKTNGAILVGQVVTEPNGTVLKINTSDTEQRSVEFSGADLPRSGRILALGIIDDSSDIKTVEVIAFKTLED